MKRSHTSKRLSAVILFLPFVFAIFQLPYLRPTYWSARSELNQAKRQIQLYGEALYWEDVGPKNEKEYEVGDRVLAILARRVKPNSEYGGLIDANPSQGAHPLIEDLVRANRLVLDELAAIDRVGSCRFRYDFDSPLVYREMITRRGPEGLGEIAEVWRGVFLQSLAAGDSDAAFHALLETCDTTEMMRQDCFFESQRIRARCGNHAIDCLQDFLGSFELTGEQFTVIDDALREMETTYRLDKVVRTYRAGLFTCLENLDHPEVRPDSRRPPTFWRLLASGGRAYDADRIRWVKEYDQWASLSYRPELMRHEAWALKHMTAIANLVDMTGPLTNKDWEAQLMSIEYGPFGDFFPWSMYAYRVAGLSYRQRLVAARLALRVDRYRTNYGEPPDSLEEVIEDDLRGANFGLYSGKRLYFGGGLGEFIVQDLFLVNTLLNDRILRDTGVEIHGVEIQEMEVEVDYSEHRLIP